MSTFKTHYQKNVSNLTLNFGQYVQLITIDWADQTDTITQQM